MKDFYIHDGESELGPYSLEQLKSLGIKKETLVWYEGAEEWAPAGTITELQTLFTAKPIPPPLTKTINESLAGTYMHVAGESQPKQKKKSYSPYLLLFVIVAGGIIIWLIYQNSRNNETISTLQTQVTTQQTAEQLKEEQQKQIKEATEKKNLEYRSNWDNISR